jgi:hypothetical protein
MKESEQVRASTDPAGVEIMNNRCLHLVVKRYINRPMQTGAPPQQM